MNGSFEEKVFQTMKTYRMLDGVRLVTVALSGGADSMSLLHFLASNSADLGIFVEAAHLNHHLRGEESNRDEEFVVNECKRLGVKLHIKQADIAGLAARQRCGAEECGRRERYAFFSTLRREGGVTATAHSASDNAETVLFNIIRGCGTDGLSGIPPVRPGIIRPLIRCTREEIESYCRENGVPFVTDSTNLSDEYSRNRLRLNVIPQLKRINPSAVDAINRLSAIAASDSALIASFVQSELERCAVPKGLVISKLRLCDSRLLPHMIKETAVRSFGIIPEKRHIDMICDIALCGSGAVEIRAGRRVRAESGILLFEDIRCNAQQKRAPFSSVAFSPGLEMEINGKMLFISEKKEQNPAELDNVHKKLLIDRLSCGIISCDTKIRTRQSGDIFSPLGRGCTKTVKKLFSEMKLSADDRETRLLIANGSRVLWIEGIGVSEDAAVLQNSSKYYYEVKVGV